MCGWTMTPGHSISGYLPLDIVMFIKRSNLWGVYENRESTVTGRQHFYWRREKPFLPDGNCSLLGTLSWCQTRMCFAVTYKCISRDFIYLDPTDTESKCSSCRRPERKKSKQIIFLDCGFWLLGFFIFFLIGYQFYCFGDQNEAVLPSVYKYLCTECHFFQVVTKCLAI